MMLTTSIKRLAFLTLLVLSMSTAHAKQGLQPSPSRTTLKLVVTLSGHTRDIITASFSPNGETIATGSEDGTVRLWDAQSGLEKATLHIKDKARTLQLEWSPDGSRLAVKHNYGGEKIQIWNLQTARLQATLDSRNADAAMTLAWSPDSRTLLTSSFKGKAMLWDAESGSLRATLVQDPPCPKRSFLDILAAIKRCREPDSVEAYIIADGSVLTLSSSNTPKLWDQAGRFKMSLPLTEEKPDEEYFLYPYEAVLSRDRRLVARYDANGLAVLDATTGQVKYSLGDVGEPLDFSPDSNQLLALKRYKRGQPCFHVRCDLQILDVTDGQVRITFEKWWVASRRYWSPNGAVIVTVSGTLLNTRDGRVGGLPYEPCVPDRLFGSSECDPFIFSADGRMTLKLKNPLKLWNAQTGQLLARIDDGLAPAAFSPTDNRLLLTRSKNKKEALIWRVEQ